jgi:hypothetical protein
VEAVCTSHIPEQSRECARNQGGVAGWGFRKSRRASRRVGRFRPVSEIEARVSERGSIPSSFRNLEGLSWEGVDFSVFQESRHRSGEGGRFRRVSKISPSFSRGGRFRRVSKISPSFSARRTFSSRFKNLSELLGEEVDFVVFQESRPALR